MTEAKGKEIEKPAAASAGVEEPDSKPKRQRGGRAMKKILVAVDFSDSSAKALAHALELAEKFGYDREHEAERQDDVAEAGADQRHDRQRDQQQTAHTLLPWRARQQAAKQKIAAAEGAQGRIRQIHGGGADRPRQAGARQNGIEIASGDYRGDQTGGRMQGLCEGWEQLHQWSIPASSGPAGADQSGCSALP